MATKACWGIDVGQSALKAVKLRQSGGEVEAVSFDVIEHAKILSQPDADEQQLIRNALDKFLSRNDVRGDTIVVGVPGQASFSRFIKLPPVELRKVPEIVKYEARQQIPFNLDEVIWDYQTMTMPTGGPAEIEVGIFAMKRDIVQDYVNDFTQVKVTPDIVQMGPVALYNYLQFDRSDGAGATLLIDVGAENTSLVISDGYRVWIRNFPLGGNNFTQTLVKAFKLTFAKAENLKRHAAESKYAREVFQAMRPVFSDLLTEVQRSIGFYTSLHRESRIERVLAMGNSFRMPGLQKFLSQNLGVDVMKIERFNSLHGDQVTQAPVFKENLLSFGVSYGLALQGLGLGTINTSLLPPEILKEKELRRKRPFVWAAAAAVVVGFGLLAWDAQQNLSSVHNADTNVLKRVERLDRQNRDSKNEFDAAQQSLLAKQKNIDALLRLVDVMPAYKAEQAKGVPYRTFWYQIVSDIWDVLPKTPALQEFDPRAKDAQWDVNTVDTVEVLQIWGEYDEIPPEGAATAAPTGPMGRGGMGEPTGGTPAMVVNLTGTLPDPQGLGVTKIDQLLIKPLAAKGYQVTIKDQGPYATSAKAQYPYEQRNPFVVAAEEAEKNKEREKSPKPGEETKEPPGLRRPWRGNDYWFHLQWVINLENPSVQLKLPTGADNGTPTGGINPMPMDYGQ